MAVRDITSSIAEGRNKSIDQSEEMRHDMFQGGTSANSIQEVIPPGSASGIEG